MQPAALDDTEPRLGLWESRTDLPLTLLSLGYIAIYAVEVLVTRPGGAWWASLDLVLWGIWAVFVVDYAARLVLARRRLRFVLGHPIDLLVVLAPFFRFLRVLRLVSAMSTLGRLIRDDLRGRVGAYLVVTTALLSFVAALGIYDVERTAPDATITTFGDALWWVLTTITTVGYGDLYPVTVEGRVVAAGLMLSGIAVLGTVTGAISSWFLERVGATDPSDALHPGRTADRDERRGDPPPGGESGDGVGATAPSDDAELLAEIRDLRRRLGRLEGALAARADRG